MARLQRKPLSEQGPPPLPILREVRCFMCKTRFFDRELDTMQTKAHTLGIIVKCRICKTINRL